MGVKMFCAFFHSKTFGEKYTGKGASGFLVKSRVVIPSRGMRGIRGGGQLFRKSACPGGVSTLEDAVEGERDNVNEGIEVKPIGECSCSIGAPSIGAPCKGNVWATTGVTSGSGVIGNVGGVFFSVSNPKPNLSRSRSSSRAFTAARFVKMGSGFVLVLSQSARYAMQVSKCLPF